MVKFTKAPSRFSKGSTKGSGKSIRASSTTKFKVSVRNTRTGEVKSFTRTVRSKGSKGSSRRRREEELRVKKVALEKKLIEDKARGEAISKSISLVSERKRSKMKETAERKSKRSKLLVQKFKTSKILKALRIGRKVQKKVEVKSIKAAKGMVQLGKGVGEGIKEIITLPFHALKNSFEYGRQLRRRAEAGDDSPLNKDIKKLAIGTVSVASFVKKNPRQAAAIVAAGAAGVGGDINAAFKKDPAFATGKAVAYLFPGTIIKGGVQAAGLGTKGIRSTTQAVNLIRSNKKVSVAVSRGNLASSQLKSVNIAIVKASKVTKGVKQDKILKTALGKVLKQRGIKTRPSASVQTLAKQVAASRDVVKVIEKILKTGIHVVVAGLDTDFAGKGFGQVPQLMTLATHVHKLSGICEYSGCSNSSIRSQRLIDGKPAGKNDKQVSIEGQNNTYESRCLVHHEVEEE